MRRTEPLQLLLEQTEENEQLHGNVNALTEQLNRHKITCDNAGSVAEAPLAINNVFQAADQAARKS